MTLGGVSAGTFLYLGTTEVVMSEMQKNTELKQVEETLKAARPLLVRLSKFFFYLLGIGIVLVGAFLQADQHGAHGAHGDEDIH
eukprot:1616872-Pyramimonas_sp.AAC.1